MILKNRLNFVGQEKQPTINTRACTMPCLFTFLDIGIGIDIDIH